MILTTHQSELLFKVAESHLAWYNLYYNDPPKFEILLELNHTKLEYCIDDLTTEAQVTEMLNTMKQQYDRMITEYSGNNFNNFE